MVRMTIQVAIVDIVCGQMVGRVAAAVEHR